MYVYYLRRVITTFLEAVSRKLHSRDHRARARADRYELSRRKRERDVSTAQPLEHLHISEQKAQQKLQITNVKQCACDLAGAGSGMLNTTCLTKDIKAGLRFTRNSRATNKYSSIRYRDEKFTTRFSIWHHIIDASNSC